MGKRKRSGSFSKGDEYGAKKSDDCDSQEELDDNLCLLKEVISGSATRCSARVQEKQEKLRRESSPSKQILPLEVACVPNITGTSIINLLRGNSKPNGEDPLVQVCNESGATIVQSSGLEEKRKKRNWELWSVEDKQLFFEALNEYGKDFDAIQNYLATKVKSRNKTGTCSQYAAKNKDQVRHFYYRTWNKISKYLHFPDDMKKASQELYGLVNYGELRKKQRVLNSKSAVKLSELVENGTTSIKFRGKSCRVKTPVCRALKRLNGLEDVEYTRVPHKIGLEFIPKDGKTWRTVQNLSHNPRVKAYVSLQRTLASVITYFEERWKSTEDRLKEHLLPVFGKTPVRLRLYPIDNRELNIPVFRVAENTSSATICLRSYTANILRGMHGISGFTSLKFRRKRKQSGSNCPSTHIDPNFNDYVSLLTKRTEGWESMPENADNSDIESHQTPPQPLILKAVRTANQSLHCDLEEEPSNQTVWQSFTKKRRDEEEKQDVSDVWEDHIPSIDMMAAETDIDDIDNDNDEGIPGCRHNNESNKLCACGSGKPTESDTFVSHVWDEEKVKSGWTAEEAGLLTIGELYLMMGQTDKLCLEYCWDCPEENAWFSKTRNLLENLIVTAQLLKKKKTSRSKTSLVGAATMTHAGSFNCVKCGTINDICHGNPCHLCKDVVSSIIPNHGNSNSCQCSPKHRNCSNISSEVSPGVITTSCVNTVLKISPRGANNDSQNPVTLPVYNTGDVCTNGSDSFGCKEQLSHLSVHSNERNLARIDSEEQQQPTKETRDRETGIKDFSLQTTSIVEENGSGTITDSGQNSRKVVGSENKGFIELSSLMSKTDVKKNKEETLSSSINQQNKTHTVSTKISGAGAITLNYTDTGSSNVLNSLAQSDITRESPVSAAKVNCIVTSLDVHQNHREIVNTPIVTSLGTTFAVDMGNKERIIFRRPTPVHIALKPKESCSLGEDSSKALPPKPFLDLPKGNRRLGRRPNLKRIVVPRVLPLLPKTEEMLMRAQTIVSPLDSCGAVLPSTSISSAVGLPLQVANIPIKSASSTLVHELTGEGSSVVKPSPSEAGYTVHKPVVDTQASENTKNSNFKEKLLKLSENRVDNDGFLSSLPSSISLGSNDFEDLLKVKRQENATNVSSVDTDSLSLSSFMEMSIPESVKLVASECFDFENLSISSLLSTSQKTWLKDLCTPENSPKKQSSIPIASQTSEASNLSTMSSFENPWHLEPGEMSLGSIFGSFESVRGASNVSETDVNFQTVMGDLDFVSKIADLTSTMSDNRK